MTAVLSPAVGGMPSLLGKLLAAVRPEFQTAIIPIDPDNPVFGRGRCQVKGCSRGAWALLLCPAHHTRWRLAGRPEREMFLATTGPIRSRDGSRVDAFDLRNLGRQARLEIAYAVQCRHDERTVRVLPATIAGLAALLTASGFVSLLDRPVEQWLSRGAGYGVPMRSSTAGQLRYAWKHLQDLDEGISADKEFIRDIWRAAALGIPQPHKPHQIRFDGIIQPWLKEAVKRSSRFRLAAGKSFGTVSVEERALRCFARFLADHHSEVTAAGGLDRAVVEHYLSWMASAPTLSGNTRNTYLVILRGFLEACQRHQWLPGLPAGSAVYLDELPARPRPLPRFIPEFIMGQLENPQNQARLPDETTRNLLVLIIETGLRANDACSLPFNPLIYDSTGSPCLKYYNAKMAAEQLVPLSQRGADAIGAQQNHLRTLWPSGCSRLFPSTFANPDGDRSFEYGTFGHRLITWQKTIGVRNEAGQPVTVTAHQFRHTLGTRLINTGVPQHVVQKMLGHASPQMTARYAILHESTVRAAFDEYQQNRVNVAGQRLAFDPDAPAADAEWIKHNLARVQASLPNGYCGRPPQQDCPHPNACLTCPDFQTTPTFLPLHRRQHDDTLELIDLAEKNGNGRLAANHRQVAANLQRVITSLEALETGGSSDEQ